MSGFDNARTILKTLRDAKAWKPASFGALSDGLVHRNRNALLGISEQEHLVAAAEWLARAQDAQADGGVSGRFLVGRGWSSSYPETTGYIVPTFLALESEAGMRGYRGRAQRCIEFLLGVQLPSGAFPGLEIAENRDKPSIFNSAQILNGLTGWHRATGDDTTLGAARRVADWLIDAQDDDGAWRKHLYGSGKTYTYMAHAACWIAEFGEHVGDARYLDAARRHLEWVLAHVDDSTGWIEDCGFEGPPGTRDAVTHTIAYTIWGVLFMSRVLGHERGMSAARRAARAVARRVGISKWLPGRLDAQWKGTTTYACLTGNAQMALIWLELHRLESDPALVSAAFTVLDLVKRAQLMRSSEPGLRGGVGGSDPLWGGYIHLAVPNWAAKFFIDALLAKRRTLAGMTDLPVRGHDTATDVPTGLPRALPSAVHASGGAQRPRVVLLADEHGHKVEQFLDAWSSWGFRPDGVVVRRLPEPSTLERMRTHVRDRGLVSVARRVLGVRTSERSNGSSSAMRASTGRTAGTVGTHSGTPVSAFCAARGIPTVIVESRDDPADVERVRSLRPDLFVYAGYGILRARMLSVAPLGTLNAHMGILPPIRGMNATEWSAFTGTPVGCTIHLIDTGIDTGDVILVEQVDSAGADSIGELRDRVDLAQVDALGRVVRWVLEHGKLPPTYAQRADEGRQYFPMHPELRELLEVHLAGHRVTGHRDTGTA
ncbi:MAG TPA: formyltransferase family protein [Gemmatimonadaceae bacterium]|jgi:folate-dependent phosphoribosylglycinamide formyltransferase PurN|nr:formyltransferase family protein [Gemmatimonadaceae bacterium]